MGPSRVELFEAIRRDERREGLSVRALAERHGVHRRTVRAALSAATPPLIMRGAYRHTPMELARHQGAGETIWRYKLRSAWAHASQKLSCAATPRCKAGRNSVIGWVISGANNGS